MKKVIWESFHIDDIEETESLDDEEMFDDGDEDELGMEIRDKIISTPFGLFKFDDKFNPMRQFEFRIGHTNFDINSDVAQKIENTRGVEALIILTRYRFIIGIGKLFKFTEVRLDIENQICDSIENEYSNILEKEINVASKNNKYWAVYMFPNGKTTSVGTNDMEEYKRQLEVLYECNSLSGGILTEYNN